MSNRSSDSLYIFILVLNLVFPVLGYTFTSFGADFQEYEIDLSPDALAMAGISLVDAESNDLSYNGGWQYWTLINFTIRAQFMDDVKSPWFTIVGDGVAFQTRGVIGKALDSWFPPAEINIKSITTNKWGRHISNDTIIRDWDSDYNWSRFIIGSSHNVFITPYEGHGNITKAVYEDAHINCTIAKTFETETNFNFWRFISWYTSIMVGADSWGLPSMFSWVLRILGVLSIYTVVMLTKELIRL